jgi:hypothetical protein
MNGNNRGRKFIMVLMLVLSISVTIPLMNVNAIEYTENTWSSASYAGPFQTFMDNYQIISDDRNSYVFYVGDYSTIQQINIKIYDVYLSEEATYSLTLYSTAGFGKISDSYYFFIPDEISTLSDYWDGSHSFKMTIYFFNNSEVTYSDYELELESKFYMFGIDDTFDSSSYYAGYDVGQNALLDDGAIANGFILDDSYDYLEGVNAGVGTDLQAGQINFYNGFEKWIVPAILIVILLGGFMTIRSRKQNGGD